MSDLGWDSVGVLAPALAAEPDCEEVPTPELRDKTSMCVESETRENLKELKKQGSQKETGSVHIKTRLAGGDFL
jgi:hypothetical protein